MNLEDEKDEKGEAREVYQGMKRLKEGVNGQQKAIE